MFQRLRDELTPKADVKTLPATSLGFTDFKRRFWGEYIHLPYHQALDDLMAQVAQHVLTGGKEGVGRAMIFMPPRHGKTKTVSHLFPAWLLSQAPHARLIAASYGATLAHRNSRYVRNLIASRPYRDAYPSVRLATDSAAVNEWDIAGTGGGLIAAGVGGGIMGMGANIIIIDDVVKSRAEAESPTYRQRVKDWYDNDLLSRLEEPGGAIVLMMCMTGDTPVLMSDGTERPLREIKVGDEVATYDNGKLATSKVLNHTNKGSDSVFKIRTISGKIVRANKRHPFLVEDHGQLKWTRLQHLTTAHKIVSLTGIGRGKLVALRDAMNPSNVKDIAHTTTAKRNGLMDTAPHQTMSSLVETRGSNIAMELPPLSTTQCMKHRAVSALFANNPLETMCVRTGRGNSVLTIATTQAQSEVFCATTATSLLDTPNQKQQPSLSLNTSDFTVDLIDSIEPDGIEEVFDVQIERTENFIANGLVSHNTRWHTDDLAGYLLDSDERWQVLSLPAIAGSDDPIGRQPGEALWADRYTADILTERRARMGEYAFASLYQQTPLPPGGRLFDTGKVEVIDYIPECNQVVRFYDLAVTAKKHSDYTVGIKLGLMADESLTILDVYRVQKIMPDVERDIAQNAAIDGQQTRIRFEAEKAGIVQLDYLLRNPAMHGYVMDSVAPQGDKFTRAQPVATRVNGGMVKMIRGAWNRAFLDELAVFPSGEHDDQVDALSGAYDMLINGYPTWRAVLA